MKEIAHVRSYIKSKKIMSDNMISAREVKDIIFKITQTKKQKQVELNRPKFIEL